CRLRPPPRLAASLITNAQALEISSLNLPRTTRCGTRSDSARTHQDGRYKPMVPLRRAERLLRGRRSRCRQGNSRRRTISWLRG
ncbi:hypothetical protein BN1723_007712, partial [Verticillium longisporum]